MWSTSTTPLELERAPLRSSIPQDAVEYTAEAGPATHPEVEVVVATSANGNYPSSHNVASDYMPQYTISRASSYLSDVRSSAETHILNRSRGLVRSVSKQLLPLRTIKCGICLEHVVEEDCYSFTGGDYDPPGTPPALSSESGHGDAHDIRSSSVTSRKPINGCGHMYCQDCLAAYVRSQIYDFNPSPSCPYVGDDPPTTYNQSRDLEAATSGGGIVETYNKIPSEAAEALEPPGAASSHGCGARASEADVLWLLQCDSANYDASDDIAKYRRVRTLNSNKNYRECPRPDCGHLQLPSTDFLGRAQPTMVCGACSLEYCFEHGGAHPGEPCMAYIRRTALEEASSRDYMHRTLKCKPCPQCGLATEKNRGCNHMACTRCKADWCWLCGEDISQRETGRDINFHFNPTNLRGCSQFSQGNGEYLCLDRATNFVWWVLFAAALALAAMAYLSVMVGVFLGTGCCLGCCFCCFGARRCPDSIDSEVLQAFLVGPPLALAMLVMTLLWVVVSAVWSVALAPFVLVSSVVWLPLIACGKIEFMDVLRLWGFCGFYLYNSMVVQMVLNGADNDQH